MQFGRGMGDDQVAAGCEPGDQTGDGGAYPAVVDEVAQHPQHQQPDRLGEVQGAGRLGEDGAGVAGVGGHDVDGAAAPAGEHGAGVGQDERVVVDVHHARIRGDALGDLVGVVDGRQADADVEELPDPLPSGEVVDGAVEERAGVACGVDDLGDELGDQCTGVPVGLVVVLAAQPVVPQACRVRHLECRVRGGETADLVQHDSLSLPRRGGDGEAVASGRMRRGMHPPRPRGLRADDPAAGGGADGAQHGVGSGEEVDAA
ncbi:hypothetical protein BJF79_07335 [Actinomadura sp. CNU-125]|nr:hypothetical protein BJF79_07335 [Actinomadura sp. CNU-125]